MTESEFLDLTNIKVLHSYPCWLPLTQTWLYNQISHLPKNIENHIVCERTKNLEQFSLPNIHSLEKAPKWRYIFDTGLRRVKLRHHLGFYVEVAKREEADILHSHFGSVGWTDLEVAKKVNLKHIVTFYGMDVNYLPQTHPMWIERYETLFEAVDLILCEGSHMAQCIVNLGSPKEKVRVHHLGVSVDKIEFKPRTWNLKSPLKILISASFTEKKGIPYALEALGQLQYKVPLEITIIGDAPYQKLSEQKEKQKILGTIKKHNLNSKVRLLGYQPHDVLFEEAYRHHIFISPSVTASNGDTEGGAPVSIIEMAATGMPIVSTTHCDIPDVIIDKVTGLLSEERDITGLLSSLMYLIENPESWDKMLTLSRKHIEKEYNARIQSSKLTEIYQKLNRI